MVNPMLLNSLGLLLSIKRTVSWTLLSYCVMVSGQANDPCCFE